MLPFITRVLRLLLGLFLLALGIVFTISAQIGYSPWEIFHSGLTVQTGITMGNAAIVVSVLITIIVFFLGESFGFGSLLNMFLVGIFVDLILDSRIIPMCNDEAFLSTIRHINVTPLSDNLFFGSIMLIIGLYIIALSGYFYIGSGFGAGPRDSLMVALTRITKLPVGFCRSVMEFIAAFIGWLLGGFIGIGSVISVLAIGFCVQTTFKALGFKPTEIKHESIAETLAGFRK